MDIISFDLDGTLVTDEFTKLVWHQGIPELYAQKHAMGLDEAREFIFSEYSRIGEEAIEWYDIKYWLAFFELESSWQELLGKFTGCIRTYPEVEEVLSRLKADYRLVITSNAAREFLDTEIEVTAIARHFDRIFSATSDFKEVKKTESFYLKICRRLQVNGDQIIHVGDHYSFDFLIPRQLGITSYFLDRKGERKGDAIVHNLMEFINRL